MIAVGVILARGGSRRLPRKNVLNLCGKPLIAYTIEAAREAKHLSRTIVSTDDEEIATVAAACGAEVPFLRPAHLAADDSSSVDALMHAVDWLQAHGETMDAVVLLQPTSPMRKGIHIDACIALFKDSGADTVISVREAADHPYWCWQPADGSRIEPYFSVAELSTGRHLLPPAVMPNGAVYVVRPHLVRKRTLYGARVVAYRMSEQDSLDIDTAQEFRHAAEAMSASSPK